MLLQNFISQEEILGILAEFVFANSARKCEAKRNSLKSPSRNTIKLFYTKSIQLLPVTLTDKISFTTHTNGGGERQWVVTNIKITKRKMARSSKTKIKMQKDLVKTEKNLLRK